ncbi:MAG: nicotinate-nucleotide adenylyltransferase [Pirellula sp.]
MKKKIGVFGGSFDPIHLGHLIIAEQFREGLGLDAVRIVPAKVSPFKTESPPSSDKHRLEMIRLAIGANPYFSVDESEIRRGGVSYSIDTIRAMQELEPDAEFYLLIGADSLVDLRKWREPSELLSRVQLVVASRGGMPDPDWASLSGIATPAQIEAIQRIRLDVPSIEIASRDIQRRVREGRSIRYLVPAAVEAYVKEHGLWLPASGTKPAT